MSHIFEACHPDQEGNLFYHLVALTDENDRRNTKLAATTQVGIRGKISVGQVLSLPTEWLLTIADKIREQNGESFAVPQPAISPAILEQLETALRNSTGELDQIIDWVMSAIYPNTRALPHLTQEDIAEGTRHRTALIGILLYGLMVLRDKRVLLFTDELLLQFIQEIH